MRPVPAIVAAALASGLAVWLASASIHIVLWPESGPQRIAVFGPIWHLAASTALAGVVAAAMLLAPPRTPEARARRATVVAPLIAVLFCAIPYLPWLPDRLPVLLVLAGPIKWVLIAAIALVSLLRVGSIERSISRRVSRPHPRLLFAAALILYLLCGWRSLTTIGLKGDEPHYLMISQSLLADRDLRIENNHRRREHRVFTREELPPDYLQRGQNGEIYSIHAPGLPALLLPAYAGAGAAGALAVLCIGGALTALGVYKLAAIVSTPPSAVLTWAAVAFTVPMVPYAWSIFPEIAGAAIVAWASIWLVQPSSSSALRWTLRGIALATLPWLHTKFVILEAPLGLLLLWRLRRDRKLLGALAVPIVVSAAAWFGFFYAVYGTPNPEAPYGNHARDWVKLAFVPRGLLGLFFDQKFGLISYAPIYVLGIAGLWLARRDVQRRRLVYVLAALAALFAISSARLYMWWGGWSGPARFLVPAVVLLAPALAVGIERLRATRFSWITTVLLALSMTASLVSAAVPQRLLLFSDAHGVSRLAETIQGSAPLTATLPMFTESEWQLRDLIPRGYLESDRRAAVVRGRIGLLERARHAGYAFDYGRARVLPPQEWRDAATITADVADADGPPPVAPTGLFREGESFWTRGTEHARLVIAPRGNRVLEATLHIGPTGGVCYTAVNGKVHADPMTANETRTVRFEVPADAAWVAVTVQASHAFRPADVAAHSGDQRLLGCQVRLTWR